MGAVARSGQAAEVLAAANQGAPASVDLAPQPQGEAAHTSVQHMHTGELQSDCADASAEALLGFHEDQEPSGRLGKDKLAGGSSSAGAVSTSGQAARAAYLRLQTSTLLADCSGEGAEWLLAAAAESAGAEAAESQAPLAPDAAETSCDALHGSDASQCSGTAAAQQLSSEAARADDLHPQTSTLAHDGGKGSEWAFSKPAVAELEQAATGESNSRGAAAEEAHTRLSDAADDPPASPAGPVTAAASAEHIPERPSSAAAEFFQLRPLPPLDNLPAIPLPPYNAEQFEQLPQQQREPVWQVDAWQGDAPQRSDGSGLSLAADSAAAAAACPSGSDQCVSTALSSPDSGELPCLESAGQAAAAGAAAGIAAGSDAAGTGGGSTGELDQQLGRLYITAACVPGGSQASARAGPEGTEEGDSPAAQLARLLGSPLTPDGSPPAAPGGSASGRASTGSGGRAARITPGASLAGSPLSEPASEGMEDGDVNAGMDGEFALPAAAGPSSRSLSQQWLAEQLQREVAALQRQSAELREALAAVESLAAARAEQAQLLRGQVGSSAERQASAQQAQAQAVAALADALREQAALQRQAEAEAVARAAAEERQRQLEEQLELMLLERGEAAALGQGDSGLLATAAELAAGGRARNSQQYEAIDALIRAPRSAAAAPAPRVVGATGLLAMQVEACNPSVPSRPAHVHCPRRTAPSCRQRPHG